MENTTKIRLAAAGALVAAALGGGWLYGVWATGQAIDRAATSNFEGVLPEEIKARVVQYDGSFWQKEFIVAISAGPGAFVPDSSDIPERSLATFRGTARPGLVTTIELERIQNDGYKKWAAEEHVEGFEDKVEISYSFRDALRFGQTPLPHVRIAYTVSPHAAPRRGLSCRFEQERTEIESGDRVTIKWRMPGVECTQSDKRMFKVELAEAVLTTTPKVLAQALNDKSGEPPPLADTELSVKVGRLVLPFYRHDSLALDVTLKADKDKTEPQQWTQRLAWSLQNPSLSSLASWLGPEARIDNLRGDVRLTGINDRIVARINDVLSGPWNLHETYNRLGYVFLESFTHLGLALQIDGIETSISGKKAVLTGRVIGQRDLSANKKEVVAHLDFRAPKDIVPDEKTQSLIKAGFLQEVDGQIRSSVVIGPTRVTVNGKELE